ncbi:MAG: sulfite exporter TauE/SafE family protein [Magnetospirillum sp.]|nr:sulfite exporter TauE/SafE family protein [Magnetospirillum sp.]
MQIYLPIAEMSVNVFVILGLGGGVGFMSGLFGVGGGFLMTPLLIFLGVPPTVAVGTEANQIVASSVSGVLAHWRRGNVDVRMGLILTAGGFVGSTLGVYLFRWLRGLGQIDLVISLCYIIFLGIVGSLRLVESIQALLASRRQAAGGAAIPVRKKHQHSWMHGLPLKMRFRRSQLYISAIVPAIIGLFVGILAAIMGVGGGFIMVPAMIYLLGMPTAVVVGTSLFQIIFVTANATFLQSTMNHTVDVVLALLLLLGGVVGAQIGARFGVKLKGEQLRSLLALMVLGVCAKLLVDMISVPNELFGLGGGGKH